MISPKVYLNNPNNIKGICINNIINLKLVSDRCKKCGNLLYLRTSYSHASLSKQSWPKNKLLKYRGDCGYFFRPTKLLQNFYVGKNNHRFLNRKLSKNYYIGDSFRQIVYLFFCKNCNTEQNTYIINLTSKGIVKSIAIK